MLTKDQVESPSPVSSFIFYIFLSFFLDAPQVSLYSKEFDRSIHASWSHKCCVVSKPDSCGHGGVVVEWNQLLPLLAQVNPDKTNKIMMNKLVLWQTWNVLFFHMWITSIKTFTKIALAFTSYYPFTRSMSILFITSHFLSELIVNMSDCSFKWKT